MNRLRFIIPTLLKINLVVALLSVVFVIIIREQQAQMTAQTQQSVEQPDFVPPQFKDKIATYQQRLQQNQQTIDSYEQQLKQVKAELEEYKTQNALLMQATRPKTEKIPSAKLAETPQVTTSSSRGARKPILVGVRNSFWSKTLSLAPTAELNESAKPSKAIEIAKQSSAETVTPSAFETSKPVNIPIIEEIQTQEKKDINRQERVPDKSEPKKRFNESIDDIAFIAQNTDPQALSPNPSELEANIELIYPTVRSLELDSKRDISTHYANNIAYGLAIAADAGQINHGTKMYRKVQTAIRLLRRGETKEEATRKAKVPTSVINQLMKWGEKRPGSLIASTQEE